MEKRTVSDFRRVAELTISTAFYNSTDARRAFDNKLNKLGNAALALAGTVDNIDAHVTLSETQWADLNTELDRLIG